MKANRNLRNRGRTISDKENCLILHFTLPRVDTKNISSKKIQQPCHINTSKVDSNIPNLEKSHKVIKYDS